MSRDHVRRSTNPLAVYAQDPVGVYFEEQERGEDIILLLRQHLATQVVPLLEVIFLAILPTFLPAALALLQLDVFAIFSAAQLFWLMVFWYLFVFGFAFYKFIYWYFNVYILTNERIVDFDFKGILHIETAYANLSQIQDVSPKIIGFFGTFFHYGDVYIQTAGEKPEFEFHRVAMPDNVSRRILVEIRSEESEKPGEIA